jgi:membrane associated rhomboid family serine protease
VDVSSTALVVTGFILTVINVGAARRLSNVLLARAAILGSVSIGVGLVIGGDAGYVFVVVVGLTQQLGMLLPSQWVATARANDNFRQLEWATRFLRVGQWPHDTTLDRWGIRFIALEMQGQYEEAQQLTERLLGKRTDQISACVRASNRGQLEVAGPLAISLLTSNFKQFYDRVFQIAAAWEPAMALHLLASDFEWASKRHLTGFAPLLAFGGRVEAADEAMRLSLGTTLDRLATSGRALHNTNRQRALEAVLAQLECAPAPRYRALAQRLRSTPATYRILTNEQSELLDRIQLIVEQRRQIAGNAMRNPGRPIVTMGLAALCLFGFVFELTKGDTTSVEVLQNSGAFLVYEGRPIGGWWRILTASFLHAGPIHLGFNLFALSRLGPMFERRFGRIAMVLYWLFGAAGGALAIQIAAPRGEATVAVGASTAIMALIGGLAAWALIEWLGHRNAVAKPMFIRLVAVIALQSVLDNLIPQVSAAGHLGGAVAGCLVMFAGFRWFSPRPSH